MLINLLSETKTLNPLRPLLYNYEFKANMVLPSTGLLTLLTLVELFDITNEERKGNRMMDGIPVEVWKCLGEEGIDMLWDLMKGIYEQEKIPTEWYL